ncbi:Endo-1,4-beta-xylanase [Morella rubra]|uniref:Endo-1,4-beta-xylanase n=1 Tax=Morella rubra TaxID=262757 RepID=A0A6A1V902_9ROSI|nr:Endo-1,4-beta-xylanase [Morella rubra]
MILRPKIHSTVMVVADSFSELERSIISVEILLFLHYIILQCAYYAAWIQVNSGNESVTAVFKTTSSGFKAAGSVIARSKCWSMLKGGFTVDESGPAELYFESKNSSVELWVDSISLQPFTQEQWRSHQDQSIEKTRKRKVRIHVADERGNPISNASISTEQKTQSFPFGCAINKNILTNTAYQNWFTSRFKVTVFENEMKWYTNEVSPGNEDYTDADAMLQFVKQRNIAVRGHTVLWEDPQFIQGWVASLTQSDLANAVNKRINSIVSRYKGELIAWDVVNENLHFWFFESKLGESASASFYNLAQSVDGNTTLFLNEFNTIEENLDDKSKPDKYLQKLSQIQSFPRQNVLRLGIGLQGHFGKPPNLPYIRAAIDTLASASLPIWITELDVARDFGEQTQAQYLEQILRELHAHPRVNGIMLWSAWAPGGCYRMCLTDNNFNNLATGNVVDKLMQEWGFTASVGTTDADGFFETSLSHGDYTVKIGRHNVTTSSAQSFVVSTADTSEQTTLVLQVSA